MLGTAAIRNPDARTLASAAHPGVIVLAVDAKDGKSPPTAGSRSRRAPRSKWSRDFADLPLAAVLYTDIARDGTQVGPNIEATARLAREGGLPVLASGGVSKLDHLRASPSTPASPAPSWAARSTKRSSRSKKRFESLRDA